VDGSVQVEERKTKGSARLKLMEKRLPQTAASKQRLKTGEKTKKLYL
jgi:hypothetical protein